MANNGTAFGFSVYIFLRNVAANTKSNEYEPYLRGTVRQFAIHKTFHFFRHYVELTRTTHTYYRRRVFNFSFFFFFAKLSRSMSLFGDKFLNFQSKLSRRITNCTNSVFYIILCVYDIIITEFKVKPMARVDINQNKAKKFFF